MSFNSGLSGVAAANQDLKITGNNIANASTVGFKASRAEFGDAYTASILGMGNDPIGSGVNVENVGQKFEQGSITQTNSILDMAIDGSGFFVTRYPSNGTVTYTRAGIFGVDKEGYVVTNQGAHVQGYGTDENGIVRGILTDIQVDTGSQPPRGTHGVQGSVNVPAGAQVLAQMGSITTTNGLAVGQAQVGEPEATATRLLTVGPSTTSGQAATVPGTTNLAATLTGSADIPIHNSFSAGFDMPNIESWQTATVVNGGAVYSIDRSAEVIDLSITLPGAASASTVSLTMLPAPAANISSAVSIIQNVLSTNPTTAGHVFVRENPSALGTLEFYTTDGTTITNVVDNGAGTLAVDLGLAAGAAAAPRIMLDASVIDFDISFTDATGTAQTFNVAAMANQPYDAGPTTADNLNDFITDLQAAVDAAAVSAGGAGGGAEFTVQEDPYNPGGFEIITTNPFVATTSEWGITSIVDNTGTIAKDTTMQYSRADSRVFPFITPSTPDPTYTVQIQIQDPNVNGGTPYNALIKPLAFDNRITSMNELVTRFQTAVDTDPVLAGRVTVQPDPANLNRLQFISSTGTSIRSVSDIGASTIAGDLSLDTAVVVDSLFVNFPPASPETIDIQIQGPNLNNGNPIIANIEPFPTTVTINNMGELIGSFQAAIDGNPDLAGTLEVLEDPSNPGQLMIRTTGPYATDGTQIIAINDNVGTTAFDLGIDSGSVSPTPALAGTDLWEAGGIDLKTVEGSPVQVQGNEASELEFNDLIPGTVTELTGSALLSSTPLFNVDVIPHSLTLQLQVGGFAPATINLTLPAGGYADLNALVTDFNNQIAVSTLAGEVAARNSNNFLELVNLDTGPQSINVIELSSTNVGFTGQSIGLTASASPSPSLILGEADTPANNLITIQVGGSDPGLGTIQVPPTTYGNVDAVVDAINFQINSDASLFGKVYAENVNDRIVFSLSELGGFPNTLDVTGSAEAMEAIGHTTQTTPTPENPFDRTHSFRINLNVPLPDPENRSGSVEISLDENIRTIEQLAASINRELAAVPQDDYIGVRAEVVKDDNGDKVLNFVATESGEASQISLTDVRAIGDDITVQELYGLLQVDRFDPDLLIEGEAEVTNGYPEQTFVLYDEENDIRRNIVTEENAQASELAAQFSSLAGVTASAETEARILLEDYINSGNMDIYINGQIIVADDFQDMVDEVALYQQTSLTGVTAELDSETGDLVLRSGIGIDIKLQIETTTVTDSLVVQGLPGTAPAILGGSDTADIAARIGGYVDIVLNEGYTLTEPDPRVAGLFNGLTENDFEDFVLNEFDPNDPETYNETAAMSIYDSLGNQHRLQMFYVKDPADPARPFDLASWTVYAQIDGEDIGDPDPSLPYPENLEAQIASFKMYFNADGTLDEEATGNWLISNWDPIDENGNFNGAYTSANVAEGGSLPIPNPNNNSNFEIDLRGSTQYGGPFARYDFQQDGYASGRLKDLEIDSSGVIYARYTNGEAQVLGQVALASFANQEGLNPVGHTEWQETFESGDATVGDAGTGVLGTIRASALEDSTVDLSEQLVNLIIAQRNYQASAKTIETANAVTQTIINLR